MTNQTKSNNLNYLIDPTFSKLNRLFVLSFKNEEDKTITNAVTKSFSEYFTPSVEIKDFNVLINEKSFFDTSIKHKEESYEQIIEMGRNNDYTTSNLLDYEYFLKHYRLIAIDLSKQIQLENSDLKQKLISLKDLKGMKEQQCFSSLENQKKQILTLHEILQPLFDY